MLLYRHLLTLAFPLVLFRQPGMALLLPLELMQEARACCCLHSSLTPVHDRLGSSGSAQGHVAHIN